MAGWFELHKGNKGKFHFVLKAPNDQVILTSEQYESKDSAQTGIASVRTNCAKDDRYERKQATDGRAFFNLKAVNHQIIGTSQMYATVQARDAGIASVMTNGITDIVKDEEKRARARPA